RVFRSPLLANLFPAKQRHIFANMRFYCSPRALEFRRLGAIPIQLAGWVSDREIPEAAAVIDRPPLPLSYAGMNVLESLQSVWPNLPYARTWNEYVAPGVRFWIAAFFALGNVTVTHVPGVPPVPREA